MVGSEAPATGESRREHLPPPATATAPVVDSTIGFPTAPWRSPLSALFPGLSRGKAIPVTVLEFSRPRTLGRDRAFVRKPLYSFLEAQFQHTGSLCSPVRLA